MVPTVFILHSLICNVTFLENENFHLCYLVPLEFSILL